MDTEKEGVIHDVVPENHMGLTLLAWETPLSSSQLLAFPMLPLSNKVIGKYLTTELKPT